MNDGSSSKRPPKLLVVEDTFSDDIIGPSSIRPMIEVWSQNTGIAVGFRTFQGRGNLSLWLKEFAGTRAQPRVCYIPAPKSGERRECIDKGFVNLRRAIKAAFPKIPTGGAQDGASPKGLLIGGCEIGGARQRKALLDGTGAGLSWIAGYQRAVPWMEASLCDLLFLTYLFTGRCLRQGQPPRFVEKRANFLLRHASQAATVAEWLAEDYPLSLSCGFGATDRSTP